MKLFFNILILTLFGASAFAASQSNVKADKLVIGEATSVTKTIELNMGLGSANPKIKTNGSTNKMQFANDGVTYKDLGSGSGGGGGTNLIPNYDFESGVSGWTTSGVTLTQQSYGVPSDGNLKYVSATATVVGSYFETAAITVPDFLRGTDLESVGIYTSQNGQWRVDVFTSGSVTTSQTLASQTAWTDETKIYFPAGQTTTKKRYTLVSVSGTSTLTIDDSYLGSLRSLKNGAIASLVPPYIPDILGIGTPSGQKITCQITGVILKCHGSFNTGTVAATLFQFPLPPGYVIAKNPYQSLRVGVGKIYRNVGAVENVFLATDGRTYLTASTGGDNANKLTEQNGNVLFGNTENINFEFSVFVEGLSGSNTTFDSRCPNDISCENTFGFYAGSTGSIDSATETLDWINGNCVVSDISLYTCTPNVGVFTVAPNCTASVATDASGVSLSANVVTQLFNSIVVRTLSGGAKVAVPFTVQCTKGGPDFVAKRTIEGFLSKTVTSTGNFIERMERVAVTTACTASPCTIASQSGAFTSITRSAIGTYTVNYNSSTWSQPPTCIITVGAQSTSVGASGSYLVAPSTSSFQFISVSSGNAIFDNAFFITCIGPR